MSPLSRTARIIPVLLGLCFAGNGAQAQYSPSATYDMGMFYGQQALSMSVMDGANRLAEQTRKNYEEANRTGNRPAADDDENERPFGSGPRVRYTPEISAQAKKLFLNSVAKDSGPQVAKQIETFFAGKSVRAVFDDIVKPFGLRSDDYADIVAAHLLMLWVTANDAPPPSKLQVRAVNRQIHSIMAQDRGHKKVPYPEDMQISAESIMHYVVMTFYARQAAYEARNQTGLRNVADKAQSVALKGGIDMRKLVLSDKGLVLR